MRTLTLEPSGPGWEALRQNLVPVVSGIRDDSSAAAEVSKSIRAGVGGGLSESDQNTSQGTASYPYNQPAVTTNAPSVR